MSDFQPSECLFCSIPVERIREANEQGFVIDCAFPISPGHTLIVSRRHTPYFFDLNDDEQRGLLKLLQLATERIGGSFAPTGYNIGINVGAVAGQTVMHVHIHLIPRFPGDTPNPIGGVRNVIPGKGDYSLS